MVLVLKLIFLLALASSSLSYKILGLFPHASRSHVNAFYPVMEGLAAKGHDVTMVSYYKYPQAPPNLKQLVLDDVGLDLLGSIEVGLFQGYRFEKYLNSVFLGYFGYNTCRSTYSQRIVQELIKSEESFDLVMMEFFNTDCFAPFARKFGAPLIGLSSCTIMPWSNARFANSINPSYIPANNMPFSDKLSFLERVENSVLVIGHEVFMRAMNFLDDRLVKEMFQDEAMPSVREIVHNASLFLVNAHFSLNLPRPQVPAVIDIGGVHVAGKAKKLPQELDKWINESTHGVIYFSLGSMIKGHTFPEKKRNEFLKAFGRLPQRVLWKYENETMPGQPPNVRIQKWMPQLDILCHPNVKAFISHGGLLGVTEAVYCGTPIVVMPQYGDQHTNAKAVEANGGGVILQLHEAKEETVYEALKTVLDPDFRRGAKELSARFRDRPLPPLETAIYWVEYVARHRGAHHMRTAAVDMPFYKYLLLDVIAFLVLALGLAATVFFCAARALWRKFAARTAPPKQKTN